jgi:uncharacterized repeat protein (TIGR01451 family)
LTIPRALRRLILFAVLANLLGTSLAWAQEADIAVSKSGPAQAAAGTDVTYTVSVFNAGPDDVSTATTGNVTLTDTLPAGMTFVSAAPPGCSTPTVGSGGTITCTITSLPALTSINFTFVFHIAPATPPGTFFTNIAIAISASGVDPNPENDSGVAVTSTPPPPQADVGVTKTGPGSAGPDTDVVYTIVVTNGGPDAASSVTVSDVLPGTMTFVSLAQTGTALSCVTPAPGAGGTVTCTAASYPAGGTTTLTLTGHIPASTSSGTLFLNTATVSAATADPNSENNASTTLLTVSHVDIRVTKAGPAAVDIGDTITYTLHIENVGTGEGGEAALNVQLSDPLPSNTTFVSLTQDGGTPADSCSTPSVNGTGTVTCTFPVLANGAFADFTLVIRAGDTTSITNTVSGTTDSLDFNPANNTASVTTTVNPRADLGVTNAGPATATAGANLTYTLTVTNAGPSTAADANRASRALSPASTVTLTDTLPPNTTFVSLNQTAGPSFSCTTPTVGAAGTITCTIATLAPGGSATFALVLRLAPSTPAGSSVSDTATVSTATNDTNPLNNTATSTATVTVSADVSVAKTGPTAVGAGANVTYTVTVTNAGPSDAASVSLSDTLPPGTTFVSESQTTGPTFACATPTPGATGTITCTIATLPAGASATFSIVVNVSSGTTGTITNTATVSSSTSDPSPGNNSASTTVTVSAVAADLSIAKTSSGPAAGSVTFTIVVTNNGPAAGQNVVMTDVLPAGTTLTSAATTQGSCTSGSTVTCALGTLPVGSSVTITIVVSIQSNAAVSNTATVTGAGPDPNLANNSSTVGVGAAAIPTLSAPTFALLALVLIVAGFWVLRRRRPASTR